MIQHVVQHLGRLEKEKENPEQTIEGYSKPRVLVLAPFRIDCYSIVKEISKAFHGREGLKFNLLQRFEEEFYDEEVAL